MENIYTVGRTVSMPNLLRSETTNPFLPKLNKWIKCLPSMHLNQSHPVNNSQTGLFGAPFWRIQHNKKNFKWKTKSNQNEYKFFSLSFHTSCTSNEISTKTKTPSVSQITLIKPSRYVNCLFATELSLFNHIFGEIFK